MKGFVYRVVILFGGEEIARHRRCYGSGTFVFDPLHYLALLKTKLSPGVEYSLIMGIEKSDTCDDC